MPVWWMDEKDFQKLSLDTQAQILRILADLADADAGVEGAKMTRLEARELINDLLPRDLRASLK